MPPAKKNGSNTTTPKHRFKCPICKKNFVEKSYYNTHIATHSDDRPFACLECPYTCKVKKYLTRHVRKVHREVVNGSECTVCGKVFHHDCNLRAHMRIHTGERPFKCGVCKKQFRQRYCLSVHQLIHTQEKPFKCSFCQYACRDGSTLRKHEMRHMGFVKKHPCLKCKRIFNDNWALQLHINEIHYGKDIRKYPCPHCDKKFKTNQTLTVHVRTVHEKSNGVACEVCNRIINKNNMTTHLKSHVDVRPYVCGYTGCDKRFKDRGCLKKHTLIHYPEYQHQCDLCDCRFARKHRLKVHRKTHINEGSYMCDYCGVKFPKKPSMANHIRKTHGGNCVQYVCEICGCVNYSKRSIILHLKYGHGTDMDTKCEICSKLVLNTSSLKEHYFKCHQVKFVVCQYIRKDRKTSDNIILKDEPVELKAEFDFMYDVQKVELNDYLPENEYAESMASIEYSRQVLQEDVSRNVTETDNGTMQTEFDRLFAKEIMNPTSTKQVVDVQRNTENNVDSTLTLSERELEDNVSKNFLENAEQIFSKNAFDKFIQQVMPKPKEIPKKKLNYVNKRELASVKTSIAKMLNASRQRKEVESLETMRRTYNMRIQSLHHQSSENKEPKKKITYFKKQQTVSNNSQGDSFNIYDKDSHNDKATENNVLQNDDLTNNKTKNHDSNNDKAKNTLQNDQTQNQKSSETVQNVNPEYNKIQNENCDTNHNSDKDESHNTPQNDQIENQNSFRTIQNENTEYNSTQIDKFDSNHVSINDASQNTLQNDQTGTHASSNTKQKENTEYNIIQNENSNNETIQTLNNYKNTIQNDTEMRERDNDSQDDDDDIPLAQRARKVKEDRKSRKLMRNGDKDSDYTPCSEDENTNKNGKITFAGHECYICFKLFKTKPDLTVHCKEHFDVCNEKMLKKCPICGFVTNLNIKHHIKVAHNINISYAYGQMTEKNSSKGSKYVLELDDSKELEIIPSIKNLNKRACMENDKKVRKNRNLFMGTTKLVKVGSEWVVATEAVNLNRDYLLPEFTEKEYRCLKIEGDSYVDRMKKLSFLAKKRGIKMLFPCGGCEKICQTMAALKLHSRKHEANPKKFKPKVWVNRKIEYKTIKRKNKKNGVKEKFKRPVRETPVIDNTPTENRFAAPQPVKNRHKCDKKLIEFYKSNIRGGDIEFWQFLKIFNKMSRENVNDFKDLENRNDLHFGVHLKVQPVTNANVIKEKVSVSTVKKPILTEKTGINKRIDGNKFTRAIMISKKEYRKRLEMKNEMRKRLEETRL